jgi:hypothetical protein
LDFYRVCGGGAGGISPFSVSIKFITKVSNVFRRYCCESVQLYIQGSYGIHANFFDIAKIVSTEVEKITVYFTKDVLRVFANLESVIFDLIGGWWLVCLSWTNYNYKDTKP